MELYLLNFWVKDMSVRDVCDRIQDARAHFEILLEWFTATVLTPQEGWKLSDLRKIASLIAESVLRGSHSNKTACELLALCVEREGSEQVL